MSVRSLLCLLVIVEMVMLFDGTGGAPAYLDVPNACSGLMSLRRCNWNSGPVCGIDASGVIRTFENQCMADLAYCRSGTYYAVVKPGEC